MHVKQDKRIPVLTYHSIDESGSVISTPAETFRRQVRSLYESGFRGISLASLAGDLKLGRKVGEKTVVLTFDDGFSNFHESAFPALSEYGFTATVFLVTAFCGGRNDWAGNPPELPRMRLLDWRQIRELSESGIEFGSHTVTHRDLRRLSAEDVTSELSESKNAIEDKTGEAVGTFAYPYGSLDEDIRNEVSKVYEAACSTTLGKIGTGSDIYALPRIDAYYLSDERLFSRISSRGMDGYLAVRRVLRAVRPRRSYTGGTAGDAEDRVFGTQN